MRKPIHAAPMRIQRMMLKLQPYSFQLVYVSGKCIGLADCLSRLPQKARKDDIHIEDELMVCKTDTLAYSNHEEIERETHQDSELETVRELVMTGWPCERVDVPPIALQYWDYRDEMSTRGGLSDT